MPVIGQMLRVLGSHWLIVLMCMHHIGSRLNKTQYMIHEHEQEHMVSASPGTGAWSLIPADLDARCCQSRDSSMCAITVLDFQPVW